MSRDDRDSSSGKRKRGPASRSKKAPPASRSVSGGPRKAPDSPTARRQQGGPRRERQGQRTVKRTPRAEAPAATLSEETRSKLDDMQQRFDSLQESLLMTGVQDDISEIETALSLLPAEIEELRTRGYVFRSFLERKVEVLAEQWEETRGRVSREADQRARELEQESDVAARKLRQAMAGKPAQVARAESAINTLNSKVSAARSAVEAMYATHQENVNQTRSQVEDVRWLLDQVDEASFSLYPAEDPVAACKAQYMETKKEGPEGILYLTDERLIMEQKEEIATKKVLFITTDKEKVQELIFEVPIGQIEEFTTTDKGFLGHKEMLDLRFTHEADLSFATLRLHGVDNEEWAGLIGRVKSGEITKERTKPKDEAVVEAARAAPTKCPTCGATLDVEIVRGMREINCTYCGSVIRL
jgi:hypothetical protein